MAKRAYLIWALLLLTVLQGCQLDVGPSPEELLAAQTQTYKFFVAGHTYGHPREAMDTLGLYPPFYRKFPDLDADPLMEFGVFTGDIVQFNVPFRYDTVVRQLARFPDLLIYKIPGNHDVSTGRSYENFHAAFGPSWYSKRIHEDLFLFLDPNLDSWRINAPQLQMIHDELADLDKVKNIFVFTHQVLWWHPDPDSTFNAFGANSTEGRSDSLNFWNAVLPPFQGLDQEVWFFAGDVNGWCTYEPAGYYQSGNVHLVTSGMGCYSASNYLEVSLNEEREVKVRLVGLGPSGEDGLGELQDWWVGP